MSLSLISRYLPKSIFKRFLLNTFLLLQDNNGTIDKDELRKLFSDMFPDFHRLLIHINYTH